MGGHVPNARTDPKYRSSSLGGDSVIQGRYDWFSVPLTVEIGHPESSTIETSVRHPDYDDDDIDDDFEPWMETSVSTDALSVQALYVSLLLAISCAFLTLGCVFCREESDGTDVFAIWRAAREAERIPGLDEYDGRGYGDDVVDGVEMVSGRYGFA